MLGRSRELRTGRWCYAYPDHGLEAVEPPSVNRAGRRRCRRHLCAAFKPACSTGRHPRDGVCTLQWAATANASFQEEFGVSYDAATASTT